MAQINDAKKAALANLGYTGPIGEAYHNYLAAETGSTLDATQDLEKLLFTTLGYTGSLYDMWFEFLRDNGFTNSLQDMLYAFWNSDSAGLSPLYFSDFYAPLTHTAVPERAAAGTTATFTRATTGSVQDHEGVLRTAIAGEARFTGARRVRNLLPSTEGTFDAGARWTVLNGTVTPNVSDPNGGTSAYTLRQTGASSCELYPTTPFSGSVLSSVWLRRRTGTGDILLYGGDTWTNITDSVTSEWQRIPSHPTNSSLVGFDLRLIDANDEVDFWRPQAEDITGRADQETPSEYVSVGVPGDWLGTEHISNGTFDTDTTGWTAGNGALLVAVSGELRVTNVGATNGYAYAAVSTVVGQKYVLSLRAKCGTALQVNYNLGTTIAGTEYGSAASTSTTGELITLQFTATATTAYIALVNSLGADLTGFWDNISVKPATYHGAGVDGVKYFDTDLSRNPLTTLKGYLAEGARTNLCLQSNAFTTTWANWSGATSNAQNAVGPDGVANSAWTITDDSVGTFEGRYQDIAMTNGAAVTKSIFIKKTVGTPLNYPSVMFANIAVTVAAGVVLNTTTGTGTVVTAWAGIGTILTPTFTVENFSMDFWRLKVVFTPNATASWSFAFFPAFNTDGSGTGNGTATGSAVFYGAQVELGSFASSYIATTTVAVTRNADNLTYSGGDIPNLKTLCATFRRESGVSSVGVIAALSNGTINEYAAPTMQSATNMRFEGVDGGVLQWATSASNAYAAGATSKVVQSTATNDIKMAKDGVGQTADTTATLPTIDRLEVGHVAGSFQLSGNVTGIYGWTRNLSQSELNAVTA